MPGCQTSDLAAPRMLEHLLKSIVANQHQVFKVDQGIFEQFLANIRFYVGAILNTSN